MLCTNLRLVPNFGVTMFSIFITTSYQLCNNVKYFVLTVLQVIPIKVIKRFHKQPNI
jgi:hypothetical protein